MVVASPIAVDEPKIHKKTRRGGKKGSKQTVSLGPLSSGPSSGLLATERTEGGIEEDMSLEPLGPSNGAAEDDQVMIDMEEVAQNPPDIPDFPPMKPEKSSSSNEIRRIPIPPHRMTPLKRDWVNMFSPLTEMMGLQVRMNVPRRQVEIKSSKHTKETGALQKGADFVKAYALGFDINDALALLRMDELYLDSFEIKDVKTLHGDHLSRAIGRIAGQDGKTKFTIENASRTRIVLADTHIHILGAFQNIKIARDAIVSLILGSPPGKVYAGLRTVASRMKQRAF